MCVQWRRSVTLDETCTLLADVQTLVDIPPRIQKLVRTACPPHTNDKCWLASCSTQLVQEECTSAAKALVSSVPT